jgi:hypothetical protein
MNVKYLSECHMDSAGLERAGRIVIRLVVPLGLGDGTRLGLSMRLLEIG